MADENKVELDTKEVDVEDSNTQDKKPPSKAEQKVELDLDDAPFLEEMEEEEEKEEEKEPEKKPQEEEKEEEEVEEEEDKTKKKKKLILFIGIFIVVLALAVIAYFMLPSKKAEKKVEEPKPKEVKVQETPPPPKPEVIQFTFRPFWVDYKVGNEHRFLHLSLIVEYTEKRINWEIIQKGIVIRDAIYYYLKNKDIEFFADKKNIQVFKKDLISIINQYLGYGKLTGLYLKEFLIK